VGKTGPGPGVPLVPGTHKITRDVRSGCNTVETRAGTQGQRPVERPWNRLPLGHKAPGLGRCYGIVGVTNRMNQDIADRTGQPRQHFSQQGGLICGSQKRTIDRGQLLHDGVAMAGKLRA
jgi:hypothetical protein